MNSHKKIQKSTPLPIAPMMVAMDFGVFGGKTSAYYD